jgi:hypothetical protein
VAVSPPPAAGVQAPAPADPRFADFEEPQSISFEELQAMAPEPLPPVEEAPTPPPPASTPAPSPAPARAEAPLQGLSWAVRLVATVPDAQPPRAILGMPDGRELVVGPATLLPEVGLAVLAIGADSVQLARFTANGDHATVESIQLTPQF